ncbi:hypothetical protein ACS0TY_007031 [Phlomoides rotata]
MRVFRKDYHIRVSELTSLFVTEGFLKPNKTQSLEEVTKDHLKDLVGRNLILVDGKRWNGRIKYCKMHDLVREVCLRIYEKEKFFYVMRVLTCVDFESLEAIFQHVNLRTRVDGNKLDVKSNIWKTDLLVSPETVDGVFPAAVKGRSCELYGSLRSWRKTSSKEGSVPSGTAALVSKSPSTR